ncbi:MAG: hypothetical protein H6737_17550 [Alphaproteobacteria bacterium]|nr:hypothetical protein [Alphaproteobacteria bacterium]
MIALVVAALAGGPELAVDWTGLSGTRPVERHAPACAGDAVLGAALVTYSRKGGLSAWGHSSLRFWVCDAGRIADIELEAYRLSRNERAILMERHPDLDPAHLRSQAGSLVVFRNDGPVDNGFYGQMQARNRDILELWLDPAKIDVQALYARSITLWEAQMHALRTGGALTERYRGLGPNCTALFRGLATRGRPVTPFAWYRRFVDDAGLRVLHPGHHTARRLVRTGEREATRRRRVILRGSSRIPGPTRAILDGEVLPDARPALLTSD